MTSNDAHGQDGERDGGPEGTRTLLLVDDDKIWLQRLATAMSQDVYSPEEYAFFGPLAIETTSGLDPKR